ncbi:MAG: hotdog fold thioesterase [Xanthomonadales bacterium]|nr:hotdog fold thioesterase [Xanthomonadales bacterium]
MATKTMSIWKQQFTLEHLNKMSPNTLLASLDIQFVAFSDNSLSARMPVDHRTHQPMGILHGGATVALAETVGSSAANLCVDSTQYCVGLEINTNHISSIRTGRVIATAIPFHLGRSTQVWEIRAEDEAGKLVAITRLTMAILQKRSL